MLGLLIQSFHFYDCFVLFCFDMDTYHVALAGLKLIDSSGPPISASEVAGATGGRHHA